MKLLATLALLISANAFACPNLTGNYSCKYPNNTVEAFNITQVLSKDGVTDYSLNNSGFAADHKVYQIPDNASLKGATFSAWCDDDVTLKTEIVGKYYDNTGAYFGDVTQDLAFSLSGTDLKQVGTGNIKNVGGTYPINSDVTCTKVP